MNPFLAVKHFAHFISVQSGEFDQLIAKGAHKKVFLVAGNNTWLLQKKNLPTIQTLKSIEFDFLKNRHTALLIEDTLFLTTDENKLDSKDEVVSLRHALDLFEDKKQQQIIIGTQLIKWSEATRFCSYCSGLLQLKANDISKECMDCHKNFHPTFQPVVIGLIKRQYEQKTEVLLARGLPPREHYSCIAGHVEPGESLEQCLKREVFEEVGLQIQNIKYFNSQLWPFPDQLMIGFIADWDSGELHVDPNEISDANWFNKSNLPLLPPKISIARKMIDTVLGL